jgi:phage tail tape-measure protein
MKTKSTLIVSLLLATSLNLSGAQIDGGAVLGSALGAATGAAVGSATGGKNGAIVGGGVGGALGAALGSKENTTKSTTQVVKEEKIVYVEKKQKHKDNGLHKGQHKKRD